MMYEGRVCLGLADVKTQRVPYFGHRNAIISVKHLVYILRIMTKIIMMKIN